jgi:hypothetical protein
MSPDCLRRTDRAGVADSSSSSLPLPNRLQGGPDDSAAGTHSRDSFGVVTMKQSATKERQTAR